MEKNTPPCVVELGVLYFKIWIQLTIVESVEETKPWSQKQTQEKMKLLSYRLALVATSCHQQMKSNKCKKQL